MLKFADRVKETSITTGNGQYINLTGAFGAFQTFLDGIGDGNSTYYTIENNSNFEVGLGTYSASTNSFSRDTVLVSSNNNQRINLFGVSIVFCTYPAEKAVFLDQNGYISGINYSGIIFPDNTIQSTSRKNRSYINISSTTQLSSLHDAIFANCNAEDITITLPSAVGIGGSEVLIKKIGTKSLTLHPVDSTQYIDGKSFLILFHAYEAVSLISNNENWYLF